MSTENNAFLSLLHLSRMFMDVHFAQLLPAGLVSLLHCCHMGQTKHCGFPKECQVC